MPLTDIQSDNYPQIAEALGISNEEFWDLVTYPDEARMTLCIEQVNKLASITSVSISEILAVELVNNESEITPEDFCAKIQDYVMASGHTVAELENRIGWSISEILQRPEKLFTHLNWDGLSDIASEIGINPARLIFKIEKI